MCIRNDVEIALKPNKCVTTATLLAEKVTSPASAGPERSSETFLVYFYTVAGLLACAAFLHRTPAASSTFAYSRGIRIVRTVARATIVVRDGRELDDCRPQRRETKNKRAARKFRTERRSNNNNNDRVDTRTLSYAFYTFETTFVFCFFFIPSHTSFRVYDLNRL